MRILVVGAGATGGYFGGRLAQANRDVTFLVRPARAEQLRADGLRLVSPHHGDATLSPRLVTAGQITSPYDMALLSVKAFALEPALDDLAMYRDLQREKRVEADHVLGDLLARARRLAVPAPLLAPAFASLSIYQRRVSAR
jgi:ketopantoate reductase